MDLNFIGGSVQSFHRILTAEGRSVVVHKKRGNRVSNKQVAVYGLEQDKEEEPKIARGEQREEKKRSRKRAAGYWFMPKCSYNLKSGSVLTMTSNKKTPQPMSTVKVELKLFIDKENFTLWQRRMKYVLKKQVSV
ncbi:Hypothetical predicted protein [Prunus dulcis]|uniref:Uncharacterized protein n=1 Tax=Prunus dulcis TaxID=3755 RepID=A0A5E4FXX4_PRUDU|nr:Hypothetical predicted protein [Prunus dulcis]